MPVLVKATRGNLYVIEGSTSVHNLAWTTYASRARAFDMLDQARRWVARNTPPMTAVTYVDLAEALLREAR